MALLEWQQGPLAIYYKPPSSEVHPSVRSMASEAMGGLVLISDADLPRIRGSCVLLVMAAELASGPGAISAALEFYGAPEEDARVVEEVPSGHFGHVAVVEVDLVMTSKKTPLQLVLAMQEAGLAVVQLGPSSQRSREVIDVRSHPQSATQEDVLPGTCIEVINLSWPAAPDLRRTMPARWSSFLRAEESLAAQRKCGAEATEEVCFCGLRFVVPSEQLRPRPSSAPLVQASLECLKACKAARILDLGVGSGALLLAILKSLPNDAQGTGVDIDAGAVDACKENAQRLLNGEKASCVRCVLGDFTALDAEPSRACLEATGYDVIVCNPPYRSEAQQEAYQRASGSFGGYTEHSKTLVAGQTGLEMYQAVAACLARDLAACQARLLAPPGPLLRLGGSLIFQVEAGSHGRLGGMATKVAAAVQNASEGKLAFQRVIEDEKKMERGILLKWAFAD